ncbi:MAG: NAD(+) synthase [Paludibacteraceae bacterium]|nr:NAD(+) synthase [Paludibacteraceae bacterium]
MENFGFIKVAAAIPAVQVANCTANIVAIEQLIKQASAKGVQILGFPELCITGYTCADLFHNQLLITQAEKALAELIQHTAQLNIVTIVGLPIRIQNQLFNCAVVFQQGQILGVVPKKHLPNYNEFYEKRWFASASDTTTNELLICEQKVPFGEHLLFESPQVTFSIEICEDLWTPIPPSSIDALAGSHVIFNLSASNELIGKNTYLRDLIKQQSARCLAGYVYASAGFGESSTDLLFAGNGLIAENGTLLAENERFSLHEQLIVSEIDIERLQHDRQKNSTFMQDLAHTELDTRIITIPFELSKTTLKLTRSVYATPFVPTDERMSESCEEILNIQVNALATRLHHTHIKHVVLGISGGLDSTLALLVCARTCDKLGLSRQNIIGITMPGFGTTDRTYQNATQLVTNLGATLREISIKDACNQHFKDIAHDPTLHNVTYENTQARERTQILMDVANQCNGLVIGTGDLSELALGWATYNGDHMSMYAVNNSIPKTLVRYLVRYAASGETDKKAHATLLDIIDTPVSPELLPADENGLISQKTEDLVGPYELHDFFLYYMLRYGFAPAKIFYLATKAFAQTYDDACIKKWLKVFLKRFFAQQFKRSCMPDGPKVGSVNLSPRGDWRMPSDASSELWLNDCD